MFYIIIKKLFNKPINTLEKMIKKRIKELYNIYYNLLY